MSRPKNSKDKKKRKRKTILNGTQERELIKDYESGMKTAELRKKYSVGKSYISSMFKLRNIKKRINLAIIKKWKKIENIETLDKSLCGIYCICFINKVDHNDIKIYIGSSVDIKIRLSYHYRELKNNQHYSSLLSEYFQNTNYNISFIIIEQCDEAVVLERETFYLHEYNNSCLLNIWKATNEEDLRPWLEKAITYDSYTRHYTINNQTGCKESNYTHKSGYGRMRVTIGESKDQGQTKYFSKHRIAFWEKYGEYPELVRHKCNNPRCYNAEHLEKGNHKDNMLDRRGDFPQIFEAKWIELQGDLIKLTQHFSDRWSGNQPWKGNYVSYSVYEWEKKLGLKEKYPEILDANENRRFIISYRKLGRKRGKKHRVK